jgi:hypothetical protein
MLNYPKSKEEQKCIVTQLNDLQTQTKKLETIYQHKINSVVILRRLHLLSSIVSSLNGPFPCCTTMLDMPCDTLALVPQHLLRLILPKGFDLAYLN